MNTWSQAIFWYRALFLISSCVAGPVRAGKPKNRGSAPSYGVRRGEKGSYGDSSPNAMAGKNSDLDSRTSSLTTVMKGTQIHSLIAQIGRNNKHSMLASKHGVIRLDLKLQARRSKCPTLSRDSPSGGLELGLWNSS